MKPRNERRTMTAAVLAVVIFTVLMLAGCGDNSMGPITGGNGSSNNNATVSLKANNNANDNPMNITITEAKFLLKEVEFELEGSETEKEVELGPVVININLAGGLDQVSAGSVPSGSYDKIKFQVHKPDDNETPSDPEFKEGNSGNQRFSFIIKGTVNGEPFIFKSRNTLNIVINFDSPISIGDLQKNITMLITERMWFIVNGIEIDPRDPSMANDIDDNIMNSFQRAFKDDDHNGEPDIH